MYFDYNATAPMSPDTIADMVTWCNMGNPSSDYAVDAKQMLATLRAEVAAVFGVRLWDGKKNPHDGDYAVILTSGGSEANSTFVAAVTGAWQAARGKAHIVCSAIEHNSLLRAAEASGAEVTKIAPRNDGRIHSADIERALRKSTCMVACMHANNETGIINDIAAIGEVCHMAGVPFFCDTVQSFGKVPPALRDVDGAAVSFHKLGGPPGAGALVLKAKLMTGWSLSPLVHGTQNGGMRGGTENVPGFGAALGAMRRNFQGRQKKNEALSVMRNNIRAEIVARMPTCTLEQYKVRARTRQFGAPLPEIETVFITEGDCLPNTLMLSVVARAGPRVCNVAIKRALRAKGFIISVGSACNTDSEKASHVLYKLGADDLVRRGALRISLGDRNTAQDGAGFVRAFFEVLMDQRAGRLGDGRS